MTNQNEWFDAPGTTPEAANQAEYLWNQSQQEETQPSYFDGRTIQLIGWRLLGTLLTVVTFGIGAPWAHCMILRWETKHTYINGKQLYFDGKGHQLLGRYLLWGLLTLITLGIYALFIPVRMNKWRAGHTRFARAGEGQEKTSGLLIFGLIAAGVAVAAMIGLGIAALFLYVRPARVETIGTEPTQRGILQIVEDGEGGFWFYYEDGTQEYYMPPGGKHWEDPVTTQEPTEAVATTKPFGNESNAIVGKWILCSVAADPVIPPDIDMFTFQEDGTFRHESGLYEFGGGEWYASGLSHSDYKGTYTVNDGVLTLHYTQKFYAPYTSEPGQWVSMDETKTQTVTFNTDGSILYFSNPEAFCDDYHRPKEGLRKSTGSICDALEQHFPKGL